MDDWEQLVAQCRMMLRCIPEASVNLERLEGKLTSQEAFDELKPALENLLTALKQLDEHCFTVDDLVLVTRGLLAETVGRQ